MNARRASRTAACLLGGFCAAAAAAAGGAGEDVQVFRLRSAIVGAGGTAMHGAGWRLDGTAGQSSARRRDGANGWRLDEGFWSAVAARQAFDADLIFANGFDPPGGTP